MKEFLRLQRAEYRKRGNDVDYAIEVDRVNGCVYLFFFGSNSNDDWKTNFQFPAQVYKKQESCLKFHRGYIEAWKSCNDVIMREYIEICSKFVFYVPVIVGHSYGSAMALLAGEDFYYRCKRRPQVITFGAIKAIGDKATQRYLSSVLSGGSVAINHKNDVVTWLVPFFKPFERIKKIGCFNLFALLNIRKWHINAYQEYKEE